MSAFNPFILLTLIGALLVLPVQAQSVWYGAAAHKDAAVLGSQGTSIYFDQEGSLYPEATAPVEIDKARFYYHKGVLRYYCQHRAKRSQGNVLQKAKQEEYTRLQQHYGVQLPPAGRHENEAWQLLQDSMQTRFIRQFHHHLVASKIEILVVLVHGFNNDVNEVAWYDTLQSRIQGGYFAGKRVYFLKIRWDGRTSGIFGLAGIWQYAQHSMYPVGLGLRRILHGIDDIRPNLPVYIMGHSTGAPLTCVALWNSTATLNHPDLKIWGSNNKYRYLLTQPVYATPQLPELRVALVAPAMPGLHFTNFLARTPATSTSPAPAQPGVYKRFVIGQNRRDFATGKGGLSPNLLGLGSTALGVQKSQFCDQVLKGVQAGGSQTEAYLIDFTASMAAADARTGHGVLQFAKAKARFRCLLDSWLTDIVPTCQDTCP